MAQATNLENDDKSTSRTWTKPKYQKRQRDITQGGSDAGADYDNASVYTTSYKPGS